MGWDGEMMMEKGCVNFAIRMSLVITGILFPHKNILYTRQHVYHQIG